MALSLTFNSPPSNLSPNLSCVGQFFARSCGAVGPANLPHDHDDHNRTDENTIILQESPEIDDYSLRMSKVCEAKESKGLVKLRSKRPARLVVPELSDSYSEDFCEKTRRLESEEFEVRGQGFFVASKKGRKKEFMEDGYGVLPDITGDPKQAFFTVIDGHGGRAATEYVAENLGKNIAKKLDGIVKEDHLQMEEAIREGYLDTDKGFLNQGLSSGACASSVLVKSGHLYVANVGDCSVVLCRNGVAHSLTNDHRLTREDERLRIENSGGFLHCNSNGVWRVQGSLAVSRAIGDQHLKEWVISEPEIKTLPLTLDCQFLILASDGLWDKVSDQEAVDVVVGEINDKSEVSKACKRLIDMSSSRGNMDDITVMVVNLESFSDHTVKR